MGKTTPLRFQSGLVLPKELLKTKRSTASGRAAAWLSPSLALRYSGLEEA